MTEAPHHAKSRSLLAPADLVAFVLWAELAVKAQGLMEELVLLSLVYGDVIPVETDITQKNPENEVTTELELVIGERFSGKKRYYYNARFYDPSLGRFIQPDTVLDGLNRYAYVHNNPVNFTDPTGHDGIGDLFKGVATAIGIGLIIAVITKTLESHDITPPPSTVTIDTSGKVEVTVAGGAPISVYTPTPPPSPTTGGGGTVPQGAYTGSGLGDGGIPGKLINYYGNPAAVEGMGIDLALTVVATVGTNLLAKRDSEIDGLYDSYPMWGKDGELYSLRAQSDGYYSNVRGGMAFLKAGDVWKYGETTNPENRYSRSFIDSNNLYYRTEMYGSQLQIKVAEKFYLYGYFFTHTQLPPGNSIFR